MHVCLSHVTRAHVCVCVQRSTLCFSLIPVDAVISEDIAVQVSPLRDKNMFRDAPTAACHLFHHH